MEIKIRLLRLGKKMVDLQEELNARDFPKLSASQLSRYVHRREISPQGDRVLALSNIILKEWESKKGSSKHCGI